MENPRMPTFDSMMNPLLSSLRELGDSGTIDEINQTVIEKLKLPDEIQEIPHNKDKGGVTEVEYRLAWTRTYLKKADFLENSSRGVWALTAKGKENEKVDEKQIVQYVRKLDKEKKDDDKTRKIKDEIDDQYSWQNEVLDIVQKISPEAFEKLIQRLLRESGFTQVTVTGKTGDGGIDGKGILRIGGILGFRVLFQCKRYKGSVGPNIVRDFRGAIVGRADKGLLVTTGRFTKEAINEATRDGAPPIDLIDGDRLVELLKEFSLGLVVSHKQIEEIKIDRDWFKII